MVKAGDTESSNIDTYIFKKELGSGAYGSVWESITSGGEKVVVKVYKTGVDPTVVDNEVKALQDISSNEIACQKYAVCYVDFYTKDGAPRIVMEYIEGKPLTEYKKEFTINQRQERNDILIDLVKGLDVLHNLGVVHQDLKPDNIMWDSIDNAVRYIDWGLACLQQDCAGESPCSGYCGTSGNPFTYPPELTFGARNFVTFDMAKAHDIWSLGIVLLDWYEKVETLLKNKTQAEIQTIIDGLNNSLARKVLPLLLEKNPQQRLSNWREIMNIIREWVPDYTVIGNVIFIKCSVLERFSKEYSNINTRLQILSTSCNFKYDCCGIYQKCDGLVAMYVDNNELTEHQKLVVKGQVSQYSLQQILQSLNNNPQEIKSVLVEILTENITEIYGVCTDPTARGRGLIGKVLNAVLKHNNKDRMWLGIQLDNVMWDTVLKKYANVGFGAPTLSRNSGGTLEPLRMTVLGLSWTRGIDTDRRKVIDDANGLRQQWLDDKDACKLRLYAGAGLCKKLEEYLNEPQEMAGTLINGGYILGPDDLPYANLVYPLDSEITGSVDPQYGPTVGTQSTPISFHTHPNFCYKHDRCWAGWPSAQDMSLLAGNYPNGWRKHYVITIEGIYSLQLTRAAQNYIKTNPKSAKDIADAIYNAYSSIETFRSEEYIESAERQLVIDNFIGFTNSYSIGELIERGLQLSNPPDTNFALFTLRFYHWRDIYRDRGFVDCYVANNCRLPVEDPTPYSQINYGYDPTAKWEYQVDFGQETDKEPFIMC